jgi:pyruvate/2-oxoglutarate dehydrogenase complex dihydrolipoamide acyltransferase (E2) component
MPETGVSVTEGTIVALHVRPGAWVAVDEPIADISTDKLDTEVPAPVSGRVTEILVAVGDVVDVGGTIARLDPNDSSEPVASTPDGGSAVGAPHSPIVARVAEEHGVDLADIRGSGRDGRIRKQDVLDHVQRLEQGTPQSPVAVPLSSMRRAIATRMRTSLDTAAHVTTWIDVDMTRVEASRAELGLTALPIIARCAIDTLLQDHPVVNSWLEGERHTLHETVNLGIAVSLGADGLIVPIVHDAQALTVADLAAQIRDVATRARARELKPEDVVGGTFTISNAGRHGTLMQTPIINPPQVAILDVQGIGRRAAVVIGEDGRETIEPRWMTVLGLSWDHRALDGDLAAEFLATLKGRLEAWT